MKLKQIKGCNIHASQRDVDVGFNNLSRHWSRTRHPFGEGLNLAERRFPTRSGELATEFADEVFCWAIVIREIPSRQSLVMILEHILKSSFWINATVSAGHLP